MNLETQSYIISHPTILLLKIAPIILYHSSGLSKISQMVTSISPPVGGSYSHLGAVETGAPEMTHSHGWQLMTVSQELSCGFWP